MHNFNTDVYRDILSFLSYNTGKGDSQSNEAEPYAADVVVLPIFDIQDAPDGSYEPEIDSEKQIHRRYVIN